MTIEAICRIDRPFESGTIEVYANEPGACTYEWRIIDRGAVLEDSRNVGYTSPGVALRDALDHDLAAEDDPEEPPVVPISWIPGRDAGSENLAQTWRVQEILRGMATDLIEEAHNAKIQRSVMNPDHSNGRLGMIYTDERTAATEHVAQVLNDAADKLLAFAHNMTEQEPDDRPS